MTSAPTPPEESDQTGSSESLITIVVAGGANLLIALAKLAAGLIGGSAAMVSEAAHSFADTITEVLLFVAVRRGRRPPTTDHPLGFGREAYFWAMLAALFTFGAGGVFAIYHGISGILHGERSGHYILSYVVLGIAAVLEGTSLLRSLHQVRAEARQVQVGLRRFLRQTPDTAVRAVTLEDSAALVGIALAGAGLLGEWLTGSPVYDGVASILIGLLLCGVGFNLIYANTSLLVGQSVTPRVRETLMHELISLPGVAAVPDLFATYLGPEQILVAAKIDFGPELDSDAVERLSDEAADRLRTRYPTITHVYLDPTTDDRVA